MRKRKKNRKASTVAHTYNLSAGEVDAGRALGSAEQKPVRPAGFSSSGFSERTCLKNIRSKKLRQRRLIKTLDVNLWPHA